MREVDICGCFGAAGKLIQVKGLVPRKLPEYEGDLSLIDWQQSLSLSNPLGFLLGLAGSCYGCTQAGGRRCSHFCA